MGRWGGAVAEPLLPSQEGSDEEGLGIARSHPEVVDLLDHLRE